MNKYDIVFGDDCMALYENEELVVAATKLTFGDIIENCGMRCDLWEADLDSYKEPEHFPKNLKDVIYPEDRPLDDQKEEQEL